ncbi:MAG: NAD(P)/FAD-dependent oxidoreductase [Candidatus Omnitrophica bacterium]|nr:NAD(P)/FAD-dependent oxidoreductase [Candidatus Omnitrophota bacterium]MBU2474176.1 NAD(P)/FAD-dependent oxidoreductase [Candidatus Omnitrophota bacterium]
MYDLAIIGAGPAGIAAARAARSAGLKTVLFERSQDSFGGTCLNRGCIPTKFLLHNSKSGQSWSQLKAQLKETIGKIKSPLLDSLKKNGLDIVFGQVIFQDKNTLDCKGRKFSAKNIIIASGSVPKNIFKSGSVVLAEEIFSRPDLADQVLIVGAGYIGIELASLLNSLGKRVRLIEKEDDILLGFDSQLTRRLRVILEKRGIVIETGVDSAKFDFDRFGLVVSATGRTANLDSLNIENSQVSIDKQGWIRTDEYLRSSQGHIYACGDVTGKKLLAYVAEYQGNLCVKNITGKNIREDYFGLPEAVFSKPQIARVGLLEKEAEARGIKITIIKSNFLRFSSSYVYGDTDGYIKVLVDQQGKIIGAGIISETAAELINTVSLAIKNGLKLDDLKQSLFIHPTISEIIPLLFQ